MKNEEKWAYLIKKYPERAGIAWEMYYRDPKKEANPVTYFNYAGKVMRTNEKRYKSGLRKYLARIGFSWYPDDQGEIKQSVSGGNKEKKI